MKAWIFLAAIGCTGSMSFAADPNFDSHQTFVVPLTSSQAACAQKAAEAVIEASDFPQIEVTNFRETWTHRTVLNNVRGDRYFEFNGSDSEGNKFTGFIYVLMKWGYIEAPLTGDRTKVFKCHMPSNILSTNIQIKNVRGTTIIYK